MEKNGIKKSPSLSLLAELKKFVKKLWLDRNPVSVELGAVIEEFEKDIITEANYIEKQKSAVLEKMNADKKKYEAKIDELKTEQNNLLKQISQLKINNAQNTALNKAFISELEKEIDLKNEERAKLEMDLAQEKRALNSDYSSKVAKLYDEISQKEKALMNKWVKKNEKLKSETANIKRKYREQLKKRGKKQI